MSIQKHQEPNWEELLRARLSAFELSFEQEDKIVRELVQLLADASRESDLDLSSPAAAEAWLDEQVPDWEELAEMAKKRRRGRRQTLVCEPTPSWRPRASRRGRVALELWGLVDSLRISLRNAARRLTQRPGFTAIAIVSLAIGIGANSAIFSLVRAVLFTTGPFEAPEELVKIFLTSPDNLTGSVSFPDYQDLVDNTGEAFSGVAVARVVFAQLDTADAVEVRYGEALSGNYFAVLGIDMALGRPLLPEDDLAPGAHPVVVLSYDFWQNSFAGDPAILGREIRLSGQNYAVVGIAPRAFAGTLRGLETDFYVPRMMVNAIMGDGFDQLSARSNHSSFVRARLAAGVDHTTAQGALDALSAHLRQLDLDGFEPESRFELIPLQEAAFNPTIDRYIRAIAWLLGVVVGLVLLLACSNLASFLLAHALERRKEIALRLALGASRARIALQFLADSLLLTALGGALGLVLAQLLLRALFAADLPLPFPIKLDLGLHVPVLVFTLGLSVLTAVFLGLMPAWQQSRPKIAAALQNETHGGGQRGRLTLRGTLIGAQVAVSAILLVGAGLFLRSRLELASADPGFGRSPATLMRIVVPANRFDDTNGRRYVDDLVDTVRALPTVDSVGLASILHLDTVSSSTLRFNVDGHEPPGDQQAHSAATSTVDAGFFEAAGIPLLKGRGFAPSDTPESPPVVIISEAFASRFWPDDDPLGKVLHVEGNNGGDLLVIGVARQVKEESLDEAPVPFVYRPYNQIFTPFVTLIARATAGTEPNPVEILAAARRYDPEIRVWETKTMAQHLAILLLPTQLAAMFLGVLATFALGLAAIGLYGVVSYSVSSRTREIGIRSSLGANPGMIRRILLSTALRPVLLGAVLGLALAAALCRSLGHLLYGVEALDGMTFVLVPCFLLSTTLLAALLPALKASRLDVVTALRTD